MSSDEPDRPGIAAFFEELNVRRHARVAFIGAVSFALLVFVVFAYLPGTQYPIAYWLALTFVLSFAVFVLAASVLVFRTLYYRTREFDDVQGGPRTPTTLAILFGLLGWLLVPAIARLVFGPLSAHEQLTVALLSSGFTAAVVGGLGLKLVAALSLSYEPRPTLSLVGAAIYTALVIGPSIGCTLVGFCIGTPDALVIAVLSLDVSAITSAYAAIVLGGGLLLGTLLAVRGGAPPHGFLGGVVAAVAALPLVAMASGSPELVRITGLYLPAILGFTGAAGGGVVAALNGRSSGGG